MGIFRSLITWLADGGTLSLDYAVREVYRPVYYGGILGVALPIIVFALVVLVWIPDPGLADASSASEGARGFRAVARDRLLLALIAGNLALVMIGGAFFSFILSPFAEAHTPVGPVGIGVVLFINTFFIVVAQIPATRVVARMRRTHALFATSVTFAVGLLAVLPFYISSGLAAPFWAIVVLIVFWAALVVCAVRWFRTRPWVVLVVLPLVAAVVWWASMMRGEQLLGW